jgi:nucleotide-binding universal stress UspA family protein
MPSVRRIAITLDAFELSAHALEQAVRLAERMNAQLEGIFIEDIDLIQIAELPFLREVRTSSRSEDVISPGRMEQELRALARRAERLLSEHATRHNVTWTFRIWRGSIDTDLLAADVEADVFALTRLGSALTRSRILPARCTAVSVLFSGTEASFRALDTAVSLATDPQRQLNILLSARDEAGREQLQQQASERLGKQADNAHFIHLHDGSIADLLDILSDTHSAVLIMERNSKLLQSATLRQSLNSLDCPLLIVR